VSRKDKSVKNKKKEVVKPEPSSPGKKQKSYEVNESNKNTIAETEAIPEVKARTIEEVLAEMNAQKSKQSTPQSSPEKKEAAVKPREVVAAAKKNEEVEPTPLPPKVKAAVEEASTFKANIAFDEMGGTSGMSFFKKL
jgi:hypothetical protein